VTEPARCINGHPQPDVGLDRFAEMLGEQIDYDLLAANVAERLRTFVPDLVAAVSDDRQLVDAHAIARMTSMSERWVYDHKDELGVIKAGSGPRPRLLFDPELVRQRLAEPKQATGARAPVPATPRRLEEGVPLLPVKGRAA
jgi:hypothetical protein